MGPVYLPPPYLFTSGSNIWNSCGILSSYYNINLKTVPTWSCYIQIIFLTITLFNEAAQNVKTFMMRKIWSYRIFALFLLCHTFNVWNKKKSQNIDFVQNFFLWTNINIDIMRNHSFSGGSELFWCNSTVVLFVFDPSLEETFPVQL